MAHTAVLLAGGMSSRMGRDKAALTVAGLPLWQHRLDVLRDTAPAELFISGKSDGPYAGCGVEIIPDDCPASGPLGGIASALRRCGTGWLLVLAVDMPAMTAAFLRTLVAESVRTGRGVVPFLQSPPGNAPRFEPLAAVYPRTALGPAQDCLRLGRRKMEDFILRLESLGLISPHPVAEHDAPLFENWNEPRDIRPPAAEARD